MSFVTFIFPILYCIVFSKIVNKKKREKQKKNKKRKRKRKRKREREKLKKRTGYFIIISVLVYLNVGVLQALFIE